VYTEDNAPTAFVGTSAELLAKSRVGRVLRDKWRLDALIGVGGMAAVYAATHRNGSRAAVKLLHTELSLNDQVRSRFLREGYVANAVDHEGAVKVLDDDIAEDGSLFLVSELLDGETLEDRRLRAGGRLGEDEVLSLAHQLLDVLVSAHAKGIVHRDLKGENVFLTRAGQVKVLDFGIARLREVSTVSTATQMGSSMGTPAFMAPEQARGLWDQVDARTDLWAVGATLYTLLTGRLVHDGRTNNEILLAAMTQPAPSLASVVPESAPTVVHLVDRALAFAKENRWPDAARMQEAVLHAYHNRFGKPISTAPRLTVPETVPNKTLISTSAPVIPGFATTARPVSDETAPPNERARRPLPRAGVGAIVFGAVLAPLLTVIGIVWLVRSTGRTGEPPVLASSSSSPSVVVDTVPVAPVTVDAAASGASGWTTISANEAPDAAVVVPVPKAPATAVPARPDAPGNAPGAKAGCNPPYTIDPHTGKRHFREECL
jgi:serine/threonine-protein kinase